MLDFRKELSKLSLDETNCVVIGSGILNALGIRESHDIDVIVNEEVFEKLKGNRDLKQIINEYDNPMLVNEKVEIALGWINNPNISFFYDDLLNSNCTTIIDEVRYLNLETILKIKKIWNREKDKKDVKLIEEYLKKNK